MPRSKEDLEKLVASVKARYKLLFNAELDRYSIADFVERMLLERRTRLLANMLTHLPDDDVMSLAQLFTYIPAPTPAEPAPPMPPNVVDIKKRGRPKKL